MRDEKATKEVRREAGGMKCQEEESILEGGGGGSSFTRASKACSPNNSYPCRER